jgi:hypothetical protein
MPDALIDEILSRCPGGPMRAPGGSIVWPATAGYSRTLKAAQAGNPRAPLPPPPRHLGCAPRSARSGFDVGSAHPVSALIARSGVPEAEAGRYLLIDSDCGHLVHTFMAARPASRWLGLDRNAEAIAWSTVHVAGADFAVLPDELPLAAPDASFDGAVALELPGRSAPDELGAWLEELSRLVRPGGFLVLGTLSYASLAHLAERRHAHDDQVRSALQSLDSTGMAMLAVRRRNVRLLRADRLAREMAGRGWQAFQPLIGAGRRHGDFHLAVRRETAPVDNRATVLPPIGAVIGGTVDAATLAAQPNGEAVAETVRIALAGTMRRSATVSVDFDGVSSDDRSTLRTVMAKRRCSWSDLHLLTLRDACLIGDGTVVVQRGERRDVLGDSAREFLTTGRVPPGLERHGAGGYTMSAGIDRRIGEPCLLLKRPWAKNFGHWLVDQATVLSWLVRNGLLPSRRLVVGEQAAGGLADIMRQTVAAILPDAELLEHPDEEVWRFDSLAYPMPLHVPHWFKLPAALETLRSDLRSVATLDGDQPRRLHVVRSPEGERRLDNEAELLAISASHGFVPVQPERLSLAGQVALFAGARAVIGVKGAALTSILFAEPDCPLIVLSPASFPDVFHWNLATVRGHPYWELYGPVVSHEGDPAYRPFRIDPAKFEAVLQRALGTHPPRRWRRLWGKA